MSAPVMDKDAPTLPPVPEGAVMVTLKIARFNPEDGEGQRWESFQVPTLPTDRLLNLLLYVKGYLDGTLTFGRDADQRRQPSGLQGPDARHAAQGRLADHDHRRAHQGSAGGEGSTGRHG